MGWASAVRRLTRDHPENSRAMEAFKPIPGHPGYEVSDHGTVRSITRTQTLRGKGGSIYTRTLWGKPLATSQINSGYLRTNLGRGDGALVHRLVMLAFVGPGDDLWVNHINGVKTDNRLDNLEYCTPKYNQEHACHTGAAPMPPGGGKLTPDDVYDIAARLKTGESYVALAAEYGVTPQTVFGIKHGKCWQWLTGNQPTPVVQRKLTDEDRAQIKALLSEGKTGREVAALFNVTPSVVSCIKNGRRNYAN